MIDFRPTRDAWRAHPLDGAVLFFHPKTGVHVRLDAPATRALERSAPRVVMFGITNRCNLACGFCSRDLEAKSEWTAESAFDVLAGLSRAGVLEVAFGGGEPLAFRGFDDLVRRLVEETALAVHFTTNGTLLEAERLARLEPYVGQIRLSIYDDNPWEERVAMLALSRVRFGVNVLVTPERMFSLAPLLRRLDRLGCRDVALLSYVGPDSRLQLARAHEKRLAAIASESPVPVRLSVCLGDRLDPVPRLFDGVDGDCGAGHDFVVLTSDRKLKACSFHRASFAVTSADDVLRVWREERARLRGPAGVAGCARPARAAKRLGDGVRVWQSFAANNSGECVLVGRFDEVDDARSFIAELVPGFVSGEVFSDAWKELLASQEIAAGEYERAPDSMATLGRTVMLRTNMASNDDFPSLRTLLWMRGGRSVYSGIHVHEPVMLTAGLGFRDAAALERAKEELITDGDVHRRGLDLYRVAEVGAFDDQLARLEEVASTFGAALSAELLPARDEVDVPSTLAARPPTGLERLWVRFDDEGAASMFAGSLEGRFRQADRYVVVEAGAMGARLGRRAQEHGGVAEVIHGDVMRLVPSFWRKDFKGPPLDPSALQAALAPALRPHLAPGASFVLAAHWNSVGGAVETRDAAAALEVLVAFAHSRKLEFWIEAEPFDRAVNAVARIFADLELARRTR